MKAMIFAAGFGTRLKPFTDKHPKSLCKVNGVTLLERNIKYLKSYGFYSLVINVHYFADQIIHFLEQNNYFDCQIEISDEREKILETGGGIVKAQHLLENDDFLLMNADILTNLNLNQLVEQHKKNNHLATLAVLDRESSRKFLFSQENLLCGWENITTGEQKIAKIENEYKKLAFSGIHIVSPSIFPKIKQTGVFSITETYLDLAKTEAIFGFEHTNDLFVDVGTPASVLKAETLFK